MPFYIVDVELAPGHFVATETLLHNTYEFAMSRLQTHRDTTRNVKKVGYRIRAGSCVELRKQQGKVVYEEKVDE